MSCSLFSQFSHKSIYSLFTTDTYGAPCLEHNLLGTFLTARMGHASHGYEEHRRILPRCMCRLAGFSSLRETNTFGSDIFMCVETSFFLPGAYELFTYCWTGPRKAELSQAIDNRGAHRLGPHPTQTLFYIIC